MIGTLLHIGIDANEANVSNRVGSNVYAYRVLCELEAQSRQQDIEWTVFLSHPPISDLPLARKNWRYVVLTPSFLWTQWRLPLELILHASTCQLFLSLGHYAPRVSPVPTVVCVLDVAFLKFPQLFLKKDLYQLKNWTKYSVKHAKHVITISENSKRDIMEVYGKDSGDVTIASPGIDLPSQEVRLAVEKQSYRVLSQYGLQKGEYLVSLGTLQPRKNMVGILHAFEMLEQQGERLPTHLVFIGKKGWLTQEFDAVLAHSSSKGKVIVTGFVDEITKYALLSNCGASIVAGFYEGFGIPALESLAFGITPIVSQTGSLPEVVGELGILIDPYSVKSIASGIHTAFSKGRIAESSETMNAWVNQFTWKKCGESVLAVLIKVAQR